mmetsp:Transcript_8836/g.17482  ORF Transcript_8836/g.17482 Transcript_8836/m.17482 type:complete len:687 (+) Transcript_8836:174-2234(+)
MSEFASANESVSNAAQQDAAVGDTKVASTSTNQDAQMEVAAEIKPSASANSKDGLDASAKEDLVANGATDSITAVNAEGGDVETTNNSMNTNQHAEGGEKKVKDARDLRAEEDPVRAAKFAKLREAFRVESLALVRDPALQGVGGVLKQAPAYFNVTEVPHDDEHKAKTLNHVWITIRRSGMNTKDVAWRLEKLLNVRRNSIGYAGLKDRYATCTQTFSIENRNGRSLAELRSLIEADTKTPRIRIVGDLQEASCKLRRGNLRGNKFRILITDLGVDTDEALRRSKAIAEDILSKGVPNYFGEQRVGRNAKTALSGYRELSIAHEYIEWLETDAGKAASEEEAKRQQQQAQNKQNKNKKRKAPWPKNKDDDEVNAEDGGGEAEQTTEEKQDISGVADESEAKPKDTTEEEAPSAEGDKTLEAEEGTSGLRPGSKKRKCTRPGMFKFCRKVKRIKTRGSFQSEFSMNAFQGAVFNSILSERIKRNLFMRDMVGDVVINQTGGSARLVENEDACPKAEDRAAGITFALPLVGDRGGSFSQGLPQEIEANTVKTVCDLPNDAFWLSNMRSTLRPARLSFESLEFNVEKISSVKEYLDEELERTKSIATEAGPSQGQPALKEGKDSQTDGEEDGEGLLFTFWLPKGSYATSMLREFMMRTDANDNEADNKEAKTGNEDQENAMDDEAADE